MLHWQNSSSGAVCCGSPAVTAGLNTKARGVATIGHALTWQPDRGRELYRVRAKLGWGTVVLRVRQCRVL